MAVPGDRYTGVSTVVYFVVVWFCGCRSALTVCTNMAAFHSALFPVADTAEVRIQQFEAGLTTSASQQDRFWVAVYMLGIDVDGSIKLGRQVTLERMMESNDDAHAPTPKDRSAPRRCLASLRTVRKHWGHGFYHHLNSLGIILPSNPSVNLAASLAKFARKYSLDDASSGLQLAIQSKRTGPTTGAHNIVKERCVQTADVNWALTRLGTTHAETSSDGGPEHNQRANKRRRTKSTLSLPSPERPRQSGTPASWRTTFPSSLLDDVDAIPDSPASSLPRLTVETAAINPALDSPPTPRNVALRRSQRVSDKDGTTTNQETGDNAIGETGDTVMLNMADEVIHETAVDAMLGTPDALMLDVMLDTGNEVAGDAVEATNNAIYDIYGISLDMSLLPQTLATYTHATCEPNKLTVIAQYYGEVRQDLQAEYDATSEAQKALVHAQTKLDQLEAQIDGISAPSFTPPPAKDSHCTPMQRLDRKIKNLESMKSGAEIVVTAYAHVVEQMKTYSSLFDVQPRKSEEFEFDLQKTEKQINQLKQLRVEITKAIAAHQDLQQKHALAKRTYTNLRTSWDHMRSQLQDWLPPDEESNAGSPHE
ncbi:hypothetical protein BKA63DRAFT_609285 [Paraphoma chrysanthemicola]|nr:hypothetical protein BKA63DRAFT_609285 [Paraphoma chrysanthemicola]